MSNEKQVIRSLTFLNNVISRSERDFISELRIIADIDQLEVKYVFDAVPSPREAPVFRCLCIFKDFVVKTQGIGKKNPKQETARLMLLLLSGDVS